MKVSHPLCDLTVSFTFRGQLRGGESCGEQSPCFAIGMPGCREMEGSGGGREETDFIACHSELSLETPQLLSVVVIAVVMKHYRESTIMRFARLQYSSMKG